MIKDFELFLKEAKKEKKKWYSDTSDYEQATHRNTGYGTIGDYYDDFDPEAFDDEFDDAPYDDDYDDEDGYDGGYGGYIQPQYPKDYEYKIGEAIEYLGNTGGRKGQKAKVHRFRDDNKIVVKFEDGKLIAISRNRMRPEGWIPPELPPPPTRKEEPLKPGQKWWEKNKKDDKK